MSEITNFINNIYFYNINTNQNNKVIGTYLKANDTNDNYIRQCVIDLNKGVVFNYNGYQINNIYDFVNIFKQANPLKFKTNYIDIFTKEFKFANGQNVYYSGSTNYYNIIVNYLNNPIYGPIYYNGKYINNINDLNNIVCTRDSIKLINTFEEKVWFYQNIYNISLQIKNNPNSTIYIINNFIQNCSLKNIDTSKMYDTILELIKCSPGNNLGITDALLQNYLLQNKPISDLQDFIIKSSEQKDIGINVIYNIIYISCLYNKFQTNYDNFKQLIKIINNPKNQSKEESQKILCGMYISNYLFKIHQDKTYKNYTIIPKEFINLLNEVLKRNNNRITKIEDLTIKEIKTLFNDLMDIKFNKTKDSVEGNFLNTGPFLQIITSLSENSGINDYVTIDKLFNKQKDGIEKLEEKSQIQEFQSKLSNFKYVKFTEHTQINSIEDFVKILGLKPKDFEKPGFKTFNVEFPRHAVTMTIDTSKSYEEFIENNRNKIRDIIMIDSSKAVNWMMDTNMLKFTNQNTQNFFRKIPVPNINYQENGTCWANATCSNSALLNNYRDFDEIVERDNSGKIIGLKKGVEENIINETNKYYILNTNIELNKNKYYNVKQTDIVASEFNNISNNYFIHNNNKALYNNKYSIKSNINQKQLFQKPLEVFKAQQMELTNKKLTKEEIELKNKKNNLNKLLDIDINSYDINKQEIFNKKYQKYKKHKKEFKKTKKRLNLIIDKSLDYTPTFGKNGQIKNFRCYTNSKHANDTILSFDMNMGNKNKKISIKFILKNTNILKFDTENLINLEKNIKNNGLESFLQNQNFDIKIKTEGLNNYISLNNSYHKHSICRIMNNDVNINRYRTY